MIEWIVLGGLALGGGGIALRLLTRGRARDDWSAAMEEAATRVGGRASVASRFDAAELRAERDGATITVRIPDLAAGDRGKAHAEAAVPASLGDSRLYFGWDVRPAPPEVAHWSHLPAPLAADGDVELRGDDAGLAQRFADLAFVELLDIRRESEATSVELHVRGGYLHLRLAGVRRTPDMLERLVIVTGHLLQHLTTAQA